MTNESARIISTDQIKRITSRLHTSIEDNSQAINMLNDACAKVTNPSASFYVATDGSDETGDGSQDRPFLTIAKAYEVLGDICSAEKPWITDDILIRLKSGTYTITEPVYIKNRGSTGIFPENNSSKVTINISSCCGFYIEASRLSVGSKLTLNYEPTSYMWNMNTACLFYLNGSNLSIWEPSVHILNDASVFDIRYGSTVWSKKTTYGFKYPVSCAARIYANSKAALIEPKLESTTNTDFVKPVTGSQIEGSILIRDSKGWDASETEDVILNGGQVILY